MLKACFKGSVTKSRLDNNWQESIFIVENTLGDGNGIIS